MAQQEKDKSAEIVQVGDEVETEIAVQDSAALEVAIATKKALVLAGIASLHESGDPLDATDRVTITAATAFIKNPSEYLPGIQIHMNRVDEVIAGYMEQEKDAPPEIAALAAYFFILQCVNRIEFVESRIALGDADSPEVTKAMILAKDWATTLSKGYKDDTMLNAVRALSLKPEMAATMIEVNNSKRIFADSQKK